MKPCRLKFNGNEYRINEDNDVVKDIRQGILHSHYQFCGPEETKQVLNEIRRIGE